MLAYITGTVDQELLLRNEYLAAENRILRAQIKGRLLLSDAEKSTLSEIAHRFGRKAVGRTKSAIKPARMRSDVHKFGNRCRERVTIKSWCLRIRDSATMERTPQGPSKRARVARKWIKRTTRLLIAES